MSGEYLKFAGIAARCSGAVYTICFKQPPPRVKPHAASGRLNSSSGEAAIGLQQVSELLTNPDVDVIGMLPGDLQQTTIYSAGVTTSAKNAEGARAIIAAMAAPSAKPVYKTKGLDPL